jgi:hypothetical protein
LPRRHISSAAGALAAAVLFAVQAPSNAQQAEDRALRGNRPAAPLPPVVVPVDPSINGVQPTQEILGTLRSTYEFQPRWAGFIETTPNERKYAEPVAVEGFRRGSTGWTALAGVNLRLAGTLFGEIAAGWGERQPIDDSFAEVSGPLVNGNLIWMAT